MNDLNNMPLPSNVEAEQAVLGCVINNLDSLIEVHNILKRHDFYVDKHKKIYEIVLSMLNRNMGIDLVTVLEEIKKKGLIEQCGGVTYVTELATTFISSSNVEAYAKIVKEKSDRRRLIKTSRDLLERAFNDESIQEIVDKTEEDLYKVSISNNAGDIFSADEVVEQSLLALEERYRNGGKIVGVTTGFKEIDDLTSGLKKTDFTVIAARPSMGKTALALNIGQAASKHSNVAIFSLEMPQDHQWVKQHWHLT